jgi:autotransporter-associated beta strand protein/ELWxxDGT repeat protein
MPFGAWIARKLRRTAAHARRAARERTEFVRLGLARLEDRLVLDGAAPVADLQPGTGSSNPTDLTLFDGSYYFTADGVNDSGQSVGRELFRLNPDGSVSLVADINPGTGGSDPGDFTLFDPNGDARMLFAATGPLGRELYQIDTSGAVTLVFDVNPGPASSDPVMLTEFSGKLYFTAFTSATGREAYVVNNGGNVSLIADLNPGPASSNPSALYLFAGNLYFSAEVGGSRFLFREAPSGTSDPVLVDMGTGVTDPRDFYTFSDKLYFSALDPVDGRELFSMSVSNNGRETVTKVANLDGTSASSSPSDFFAFGDNLYFSATGTSGRELFRLSSTGTISQLDLAPGAASSSPSGFVSFQGDMYFAATVGGTRGLWRLDTSTPALAAVAVPLPAGVTLPQEAVFYALADELYFAADGPAGRELYRMNTGRVVTLAADVNAGPASSNPAEVILFGGKVYFVATEAGVGRELFFLRRDPSSIRVDGNRLIFNDDAGDKDNRLVISSTGTHLVIVDENGHTVSILTPIAGAAGDGTSEVIIPLASLAGVTALDIFTRGGNDSATFDLSANANSLLAQFATSTYDGGTNTVSGDKARFVGDGITSSVYTPDAATTGSGLVVVSTPAESLTFSFLALEPVDFTGMAEAKLLTPATATGADVLAVAEGLDGLDGLLAALVVSGTVGGTAIETGHFFGNQSVVIVTSSGPDGTDSVTIASAANAHGNANLTIDTGPLGQDAVQISGNATLAGQFNVSTGLLGVQAVVLLGGPATLMSRGDTTFGSSAQLVASQVAITAGGAITMADGAVINAGAGTIALAAAGNITLGRLVTTNSTASAVAISSTTGSILDAGDTGGPNVVAEGLGAIVTITAPQNVGSAASPLDLAVRHLVVTSGGDQRLNELDDLASLNLSAGSAVIHLTTGGQIQDADAALDIVGGSLVLNATRAGTLAQPIQTQLGALSAAVSSGDLHLTESDGLTVVSAVASLGNVNLRSITGNIAVQNIQAQLLVTLVAQAGAILAGPGTVHVAAADLELSAATGIGTAGSPLAIQVTRVEASGGAGGVFLTTPGSVQVGGISPSLLNLTGLSAVGSDIRLASGGSVSTVESVTTTLGGAITLAAAVDLTLGALVQSAAGAIVLPAGRDLTALVGANILSTSGPITLTADADALGGGGIVLADGTLVDAGSGPITLRATGDIVLGRLVTTNTTAGAVLVESTAGRILDGGDAGGPDITAEGVGSVTTLRAALGIGTSGNPLDLAVRNLTTVTSGDQFLAELDDLAGLDLNAGSGNIRLTAGGAVQDADAALDIRAADLWLQAATAGSWANPLQTQLTMLTATATSGDLYFQEQDGLTVTSATATAPGGDVGITSLSGNLLAAQIAAQGLVTLWAQSGAIQPTSSASVQITAENLELSAATGIGTAASPLAIQATRVEASGGTGGVFLTTPGSVQVGGISPSLLNLTGLSAVGSDIVVGVAGTLITMEAITTTGSGVIHVSAGSDLIVQRNIASEAGAIGLVAQRALSVTGASITSTSGPIALEANPGAIPAPGSFSGITLSGATIGSATGNITLRGQGGAAGGHGLAFNGSSVGQTGSGDVLLAGLGTGGLADIAWDTLTLAKSGGTYTFQDTVQGGALIVLPGPYRVVFLDSGTITQGVNFQNTGGVVLGDEDTNIFTFTGGLTSTAGPTTIQGTIITAGTDITLGSTTLISTVTLLTSGGDISAGQISGAGVPLVIHAGTGDVTLADPANVIGDLTITADELTLLENDAITQGGAWTTTGLTTLNSGLFAIVLTNPANQFGPLSLTGSPITVVEAGTTELSSVSWTGELGITTAGNLVVSGPITGSGTAQLAAAGSVTFGPGGSLVSPTAANVNITAGTILTMADGALIDAGSGSIALRATGDIALGRLVTTNSTPAAIAITSTTGSVLDGGDSGGPNVVAEGLGAIVTITAAGDVGSAASPLDLAVRHLVVTSGGDQFLNELDDLASLNLIAGSAGIFLTAGGQIHDADGAVDVSAVALAIVAAGAGSSANPLQTTIDQLEAAVGAGGLYLTDVGGLVVGGVTTDLKGIQSSGGNIRLAAGGSLLVVEGVRADSAGTIELSAAEDVTLEAPVESGNGNITLSAADDILGAAAASLTTVSGTILLLADSNNLAGGTIQLAGDIDVGAGQVIFRLPDSDGLVSGTISGTGGVVKQGPGTLTIAPTSINTYTGPTQIQGGTLHVDGAIGAAGAAGPLTLMAGTTLTGGGDVNAPIFSSSTTSRIESLGNLALGDSSIDGFDFAGTLLVAAGHNVTLRDADLAKLGILTSIAAGDPTGVPPPGRITAQGGVEVGSGERLAGFGAVNGDIVVLAGGSVTPGASPGIVSTSTGNLTLLADSIYAAEVTGFDPGDGYDQIRVQGTVNLNGAVLSLGGGSSSSFRPQAGTVFTLIENDGADPVADPVFGDPFRGLPEGATVRFGGIEATISYVGGTGNDVTLTVTELKIIRTLSPDAVVLVQNDTGGGGTSFTQRTQVAPVILVETARPVTVAQATDTRPQALDTRAVERLRVFLKVVDEVTGEEEGKDIDLDPRVIDDVLGFFQRYRFPNGRYRIYLQEAGKSPRLIIEISIRDGRAVSPETLPAPKEAPPNEAPRNEAAPQEAPPKAPAPQAAVPEADATAGLSSAQTSPSELTHTDEPAPYSMNVAPSDVAPIHRWSAASASLSAGLALAATAPRWRERVHRLLADARQLPRTRFHRILTRLSENPPPT